MANILLLVHGCCILLRLLPPDALSYHRHYFWQVIVYHLSGHRVTEVVRVLLLPLRATQVAVRLAGAQHLRLAWRTKAFELLGHLVDGDAACFRGQGHDAFDISAVPDALVRNLRVGLTGIVESLIAFRPGLLSVPLMGGG